MDLTSGDAAHQEEIQKEDKQNSNMEVIKGFRIKFEESRKKVLWSRYICTKKILRGRITEDKKKVKKKNQSSIMKMKQRFS